MKIKKVHIENFRSIKMQDIDCANRTIFIGSNGTGKSTVLNALHAFFDLTFHPQKEDYFAHKLDSRMEITVTFNHFTEEEAKEFESKILNGEMTVSRAWSSEPNEKGAYVGQTRGNPDFSSVREASSAADKKKAYISIAEKYALPSWSKVADAEMSMTQWEKDNPDKCSITKDNGQFFGFKHVGAGKLQNAANFILIEAVKNVSEDSNDNKSSPIGQLMDLIVRTAMKQNQKILDYQNRITAEYAELTDPSHFPHLSSLENKLTGSLQTYYQGVGVKLEWKENPGIVLPPPQASILFKEDQLEYPVSRAGNGIQRAFIISLLHQLSVVKSNTSTPPANDNPGDKKTSTEDTTPFSKLPSVILAIEEPELYQHPTKQWHFAQVIKALSSGALTDIFGDVQILFCTHSPTFVDLSDFHNTRITTKEICAETNVQYTKIKQGELKTISSMMEHAWEKPPGSFTDESMKARLHIFGTELSEGFFAEGVILVEGASDKALFTAVADSIGLNLAEHNISLICVDGKSNLDKPWMVFSQLGIPVYPIFDSDENCKPDDRGVNIKTNRAIQRMLGVKDEEIKEFPDGVFKNYACFKNNMNDFIEKELGETFKNKLSEVSKRFSLPTEKGRKNPYVLTEVIQELLSAGTKSTTAENIVKTAIEYIQKRTTAQKKSVKEAA